MSALGEVSADIADIGRQLNSPRVGYVITRSETGFTLSCCSSYVRNISAGTIHIFSN